MGELEYLRWDSLAQFWYEYRLTWRRPEDSVVGPDAGFRQAWFAESSLHGCCYQFVLTATRSQRTLLQFAERVFQKTGFMMTRPNKSPEPTAVGAVSSAIAVHVASRRWLSFFR